jgi:hypothetical protein
MAYKCGCPNQKGGGIQGLKFLKWHYIMILQNVTLIYSKPQYVSTIKLTGFFLLYAYTKHLTQF